MRLPVVCAVLVVVGGLSGTTAADTIVRFDTSLGSFDVQLYDSDTPVTVQNFLNYVGDGDYIDSFFHRLASGFVLQGGGFIYKIESDSFYLVPTDAPIVNEFLHSNVRGTIAMAKQGGDPNSATSQFFFNLADNSANLDVQNGGFTVFGYVMGDGMQVVDRLAGAPPNPDDVQVWHASSVYPAWGELPLIGYVPDGRSFPPYLEMVHSIAVLLAWDGPTGSWSDASWYDGTVSRSPAGAEAMVVRSGQVDVDAAFIGLDAAASLSLEGGTVNIADTGQLEVTGTVSVAETGTLLVDGLLAVDRELTSQGAISGSGTIAADTVFLSGTLAPSEPAGVSGLGSVLTVQAVPEPSSLLLVVTTALAVAVVYRFLYRSARSTRG